MSGYGDLMCTPKRVVHSSSGRIDNEILRCNRFEPNLKPTSILTLRVATNHYLGDTGAVQRTVQVRLRHSSRDITILKVRQELIPEKEDVVLLRVLIVVGDVNPLTSTEGCFLHFSNGHLDGLLESWADEFRPL